MPSTRRPRPLLAASLALLILAGCPAPNAPGPTGPGKSPAATKPAKPTDTPADPGNGAGTPAPITGNAGSTGTVTGTTAGSGTPVLGAPVAIDREKYLVGRVFAPNGILSNNGGNVIGQNGGSVIGQNGGTIISNNGGNVIGQNGGSVIGQNGANVIGQNGANVIGQNGANVIGQNGGSVIGQNGANVIGQNGGSIISNNGGSLGQRPLAYAALRVVDAAGKAKLGKNGQPLEGQADAYGQFLLPKDEIDANSVIKVTSPFIVGELSAFIAKDAKTPDAELAVDMVSTLSATYVLDRYVGGEQATLARLTPEIEAEARQDLTAALTARPEALGTSTAATAVVNAVDGLIRRDAAVQDVFGRIEKLLILAGTQREGDGMAAVAVDFDRLGGVVPTPEGVYTFTAADHRLRLVDPTGQLRNVVAPDAWPYPIVAPKSVEIANSGLAYRDGWLYLSDSYHHRVVRVKGGKVEVLAGTGEEGNAPAGTKATEAAIAFPTGVAVDAAGLVYFSDSRNHLVRRIAADGKLETVVGGGGELDFTQPVPGAEIKLYQPQGLAFGPDGVLAIADGKNALVRLYAPATGTVTNAADRYKVANPMAVAYDGNQLYVLSRAADAFFRIVDREAVPVGPLAAGGAIEAGWLANAESLAIANGEAYLQREDDLVIALGLDAARKVRPLAGVTAAGSVASLQGAARLAVNAAGDVLVADERAYRVHLRRKGGTLTTIAGNGQVGFVAAGPDARALPIGEVRDVVWDGPDAVVFLNDDNFPCVKRMTLDGKVETLAGTGKRAGGAVVPGPALTTALERPRDLVRLRDGRLILVEDGGALFELTADRRLAAFPAWPGVTWPASLALAGDRLVMMDVVGGAVVAVEPGGAVTTLATQAELLPVLEGQAMRAVALDAAGRLHVGTSDRVLQKAAGGTTWKVLAGRGGALLNGTTRDESIRQLQDLAVTPDGDLLLLELDQLKQIPASRL